MAQSFTVAFEHKVSALGKRYARTRFGRKKCITVHKHLDYFYATLYDNRNEDSKWITLGMDELDELCIIREAMNEAINKLEKDSVQVSATRPPTPVPSASASSSDDQSQIPIISIRELCQQETKKRKREESTGIQFSSATDTSVPQQVAGCSVPTSTREVELDDMWKQFLGENTQQLYY